MHLLQIFKQFPFREDIEELIQENIWTNWPADAPVQPDPSDPLGGTLLAEPEVEPQQWLLALHLIITWPDRIDTSMLMRDLDIDGPTAQKVLFKVKDAVATHTELYTRLAKSLTSCVRCG